MKKFHLNIAINKKYQHAGTKANVDCKNILINLGYTDLEISFVKSTFLFPFNLATLLLKLAYYFYKIPKGSLIVTQYPLLGINKYFTRYANLLRKKGCTVCCIIHDLDSLREKIDFEIKIEIESLSAYDIVIAHNKKMSAWLKENGYKGQVIEIILFDYLTDPKITGITKVGDDASIIFAGNLAKCGFINDIHKVLSVKFNLYGPDLNPELKNGGNNFQWLGSYPINEIIYRINGNYGLVWDGPSIDECTGTMGNYMQYNTPHKLSLYLAAGYPVIFPKSGALAGLIEEKKLGITVNSLFEIDSAVNAVTDIEYAAMCNNVTETGSLLKKGAFFTAALSKVENIWLNHEKVF